MLFKRSNNKRKRGYSRDEDSVNVTTAYPTDPAALRRLNSQVNNKHARLPESWLTPDGKDPHA